MEDLAVGEKDLVAARTGDSVAFERLFAPVKGYALGLSRRFFVAGWEKEDLYQEALAGFAAGLISFDSGRGADFHDYARLAMRNAVVACVRRATRDKRRVDGRIASFDLLDGTACEAYRPDVLLEQRSECDEVLLVLREALSVAEWSVLSGVLAGASLGELASDFGLTRRAAENALSRARAKARRLLNVAA